MQTTRRIGLPVLFTGLMTLLLTGCAGPNLMERVGRAMNNPWGLGCCGAIILILDVMALLEVAGDPKRSFGDKLLWALLIFFFPVGGLLIYYLVGRK